MFRSASVAKYRDDSTLRPFATKSHEGSGPYLHPEAPCDERDAKADRGDDAAMVVSPAAGKRHLGRR